MFGKHTLKFSWMPFVGKALWARVVQCSFNCIHFHCCKIARWNMEWIHSTLKHRQEEDTISVVQLVVVLFAGGPEVPRSIPLMVHGECFVSCLSVWKNNRTCVLKVGAIFETSHFSTKSTGCSRPGGTNQRPLYRQPVAQPTELSWFTLTCTLSKCLWITTCLIFNSWWIFSPCNMFMCTNKTCFAGVGTWPKPLFRIRITCFSYPCESKEKSKISVSKSGFDSRCKPGVFCSWMELDFCFAIENSRSFKTVICSTNSSSHCLSRDAEHIRLTAFRWRCDEVEMRGTCLGAENRCRQKL